MSQDQYAVYVEEMDERAKREIALAFFMGWLDGFTDSGGTANRDDIEDARARIEERFGVTLLAFGQSETRERSET